MTKLKLNTIENKIKSTFQYNILEYRVVDGDTVEVLIDIGFHNYKRMMVRLLGVDTPEMRGADKDLGEIAKGYLAMLFGNSKNLILKTVKQDIYNRWLGSISSAETGFNFNDEMKQFNKS